MNTGSRPAAFTATATFQRKQELTKSDQLRMLEPARWVQRTRVLLVQTLAPTRQTMSTLLA
jgi:hypothetical protein